MALGRETIGQAWVAVTPDTDNFGREAERGVGGALRGLAGAAAGMFAAVGVTKFVGDVIGAAGDMAETISKTNAIFGEQSTGLQTWAEGAATALGQSKQQALDAASTFAVFGKGAGLAGQDLATFATDLTGVASDLASFHNASPEEAIQALGAGLRGEAEPLRRFGILLDDATLRAKALEMGLIATTKDALTPQQKVLASQAVIMSQLGDAQGDFARTSDGLANKQRILSAEWANAKTQIGEAFLPIALKVVSFLADNLGPALEMVQTVLGQVAAAFQGTAADSEGFLGFIARVGEGFRALVAWVQENWPTIRDTITTVVNAIGTALAWWYEEVIPRLIAAISAVVVWVQENWPAIQETIAQVVDWIATNVVPVVEEVVGYIVEQFSALVGWVRENWPAIQETIATVINAVRQIIEVTIGVIADAWGAWGDELKAIVTSAFETMRVLIESAVNIIRGIIETVMALIRGDWGAAWDGIKTILSAVWTAIVAIVKDSLERAKQVLSMAWDSIKGVAKIAWDGIKTTLSAALDGVVSYFTGLPDRLLGVLVSLGDAARSLGGAIVDGIGRGLATLGGAIVNPFKTAWNAVADLWNRTVGALSIKVPGWVPGVGGKGFDMPDLPRIHAGGIFRTPSDPGGEGLAWLQDGEEIRSRGQVMGAGSGPVMRIENFYANSTLDVEEVGRTLGFALSAEGVAT